MVGSTVFGPFFQCIDSLRLALIILYVFKDLNGDCCSSGCDIISEFLGWIANVILHGFDVSKNVRGTIAHIEDHPKIFK